MPSHYLEANCPIWFSIDSSSPSALTGSARVPTTPWATTGVELRIEGSSRLTVREQTPGTKFPARCPERHIQRDQTFCLGLRSLEVSSKETATQWWEQLRQFICCQSTAEKTGIWPPAHALDHGEAGIFHERAIIAARELRISEDYTAAYIGEPSWITDRKLRLVDKKGNPINRRAPCPMGCRHKRRKNRPILRKDCSRRSLILELAVCEAKRKVALARYWEDVRAVGEVCCGKMKACGLR